MQQWSVNYYKIYDTVVNCRSVRSILAIASILEFPIRPIDFALSFTQADLDGDVFMELSLVIVVDGNRGAWVLKFKNHFIDSSKQMKIGLIF